MTTTSNVVEFIKDEAKNRKTTSLLWHRGVLLNACSTPHFFPITSYLTGFLLFILQMEKREFSQLGHDNMQITKPLC